MMTNTVWALECHPRSWAAALLAALVTGAAVAAPVYQVIDLGDLSPRGDSQAYAINARGNVVGETVSKKFLLLPVLFGKHKPLDLIAESGVGGTRSGRATAINGDGDIAGILYMKNGKDKPFIYRQGAMEVVEGGPKSLSILYVGGLSDLGHLLVSNGKQHTVRQPDGTWVELKPWNHSRDVITSAINRQGTVVGFTKGDGGWNPRALVWREGEAQRVPGTEGDDSSVATAINRRGDIAGAHRVGYGEVDHAFVLRDGVLTDLTGPNTFSRATGLDNLGRVIGFAGSESSPRAFLYQDGQMMMLDDLIEPAQQGQWQILEARDINDAGEIAAQGVLTATGNERALKLVPVTTR